MDHHHHYHFCYRQEEEEEEREREREKMCVVVPDTKAAKEHVLMISLHKLLNEL